MDNYWDYWGDVSWQETDTSELDDFWASSSEQRDVSSVGDEQEEQELDGDDIVCAFSRMNDNKYCGYMWSVDASCGPVARYAVADFDPLVNGDSGRPWFWNNMAWGNHHGHCKFYGVWKAVWTPADNFISCMGMVVATN